MSAPGFTPIQLYFSTTAAATPSAGNLANGELAVNITDGRLFYKDNGGTVRVLAGTGGSGVVAGSNTQVQFNNNGVFGASANMVFNGTRLTVADLADSGLTSGRVTYASTGGALVDSANLTFDGTILSTTSAAIGGTLGMTVGGALNGTTINSTGVLLGGTQTLTINAGTANGVAYLNGSKVLTTGSALTFDGTNLGVGTASPANKLDVQSTSNTSARIWTTGGTIGNYAELKLNAYNNFSGQSQAYIRAISTASGNSGTALAFAVEDNGFGNPAEQMRLTSTGLGIGTSSPSQKLTVSTSASDVASFISSDTNCDVYFKASGTTLGNTRLRATGGDMVFITGLNDRMRLDSSGNLGLGVTPSAWNSGAKAFQLNTTGCFWGVGGQSRIGNNHYFDTGGTFRYLTSGAIATDYSQTASGHNWLIAPSGTAGNAISFTQAMTLDASGRLLVGCTTGAQGRLAISGSGGNTGSGDVVLDSNASYSELQSYNSKPLYINRQGNNVIVAAESGSVGIGTTSPGAKLHVEGGNVLVRSANLATSFTATSNQNTGYTTSFTTNWDENILLISAAGRKVLEVGGFTDANVMRLFTGNTERARIDASGNFGVGTSSPEARLDVRGSATNFDGIRVLNTESSSGVQTTSSVRIGITNSVGVRYTKIQAIESNTDSNSVSMAFFVNSANAVDSEFEAARIDSAGQFTTAFSGGSGSVGIRAGTSTAAASNFFFFMGTAAGVDRFQVRGDGNVYNTNGVYGTLSDLKRKENVTDATPKLEKLQQVRVVNYNLIGEEQKQLGVIAQELEQIFPSMVEETSDRDKDGNDLGTTTKAVKYSVFVPMLIKAMQEQQAIIESLKARLDAANL